jgi:hypothetical protein
MFSFKEIYETYGVLCLGRLHLEPVQRTPAWTELPDDMR